MAANQSAEPQSEQSNAPRKVSIWGSRIISALLGIAVTVIGSVILQKIQSKEPHLTFSSVDVVPFSGQNGVVGIYQVVVRNDGKSEIEGVASYIRIPNSKIEQYRVLVAPSLTSTTAPDGTDAMRLSVPSLNPNETAQVSILASNPTYLPARPEISVRGKGITGVESTSTTPSKEERPFFLVSLSTAVAALASTSAFYSLLFRRRRLGLVSQKQHLKSICEMHGLHSRAARYGIARGTTYYGEADRLGDEAVQSGDPQTVSDIKKILVAMSAVSRILDSSRAIVLYNLARIAVCEDKQSEAEAYIAQAKAISADEIQGRLRLDPLVKSAAS